ncbi:unnamed protein product [Caenorhabditis angaria]|uniref:DNA polymerase alpha catalytic subunit N-terminal domain-containing protein n=1 Tax=Caenorhabditis angaria TaxID=860376 RepID=A0A9P1ILX2_9PELO|nr:unnamed protein product [Caenorhabditis angaria]
MVFVQKKMSDTENHEETDIRRSSRRRESSKQTSRKSAIERLKEARETGKSYRPNLDVDDVYEVVDEREYNDIVSQRQNDNFVVDDDGMGYVDTGVDFEEEYEDDYEEYGDRSSKKGEKKSKKSSKEKKKGALDSFFAGGAKKTVLDESKVKVNLEEDEDLKNMLGDILDGEDDEEDEREKRRKRNIAAPLPKNPFKRGRTSSPPSDDLAPRPIAKKAKTNFLSKNATPKQQHLEKPKAKKVEEPIPEEKDDDDDYGVPDYDDNEPIAIKNEVNSPVKKPVQEKVL